MIHALLHSHSKERIEHYIDDPQILVSSPFNHEDEPYTNNIQLINKLLHVIKTQNFVVCLSFDLWILLFSLLLRNNIACKSFESL